jgi:hypothetical protein
MRKRLHKGARKAAAAAATTGLPRKAERARLERRLEELIAVSARLQAALHDASVTQKRQAADEELRGVMRKLVDEFDRMVGDVSERLHALNGVLGVLNGTNGQSTRRGRRRGGE